MDRWAEGTGSGGDCVNLRATWVAVAVLRMALPDARSSAQARPAHAAVIDGVVTDTSLAPLGDAVVSLLGSSIRVTTGANGRFRIVGLPAGEYVLLVRRIGYLSTSAPTEVVPGDTLRQSFALERAAVSLDTVVVAEKTFGSPIETEFEQRRRLGWGQFMRQADIAKLGFVEVSDLLRTFHSVTVTSSGAVNSRLRPAVNCPYQFFLDGVPLAAPVLDYVPRPSELLGIEVYAGIGTVPMAYQKFGTRDGRPGGAACGVILIWSKRGGERR